MGIKCKIFNKQCSYHELHTVGIKSQQCKWLRNILLKNMLKKASKMTFSKLCQAFSLGCILIVLSAASCEKLSKEEPTGESKPIKDLTEYRAIRANYLNRPRPIIHNFDGTDVYLYPSNRVFSIQNFLDYRIGGLIGSSVSTISYCTITSSFGQFTHNTKVGEFLTLTHQRPGTKNVTPEFVKLGTDPLEVVTKFARENNFEIFWSNRINDTHDVAHRVDKPYERYSKLKQAHPEYLFGYIGERLPHGRWSAVDFSHKEIRDLCVQYYTEVCENYDIDGIELDFFRHLYLFKEVARGEVASAAQLAMLTDMLSQIREMTERVGMKKGKPILILVRIPDSIDFCKGVGIDLEEWMQKGLIDIVVGSDYFRLNFWSYLVEQGHKYGVKVYAGLSEPRITDEHPSLKRGQDPVYRARSAAAWQAGVDGLYIFNEYKTRSQYLREIDNPQKLKNKNNLYFVTYLHATPRSYLVNGDSYVNLPLVTPKHPVTVKADPLKVQFEIGDESVQARVSLMLYTKDGSPENLKVKLNNVDLEFSRKSNDGLSFFVVPHNVIQQGINEVEIEHMLKSENMTLLDAAILFQRD
jgi:hypothetical protein